MSNSLEERLKTHSSAFDGLLSLIPAKYYYDDATQDQWNQKKKTKEEIAKNKRAKLDPNSKNTADDYNNSHASAKDVMTNKAKTAKKVEIPSMNKFPKAIQLQADDSIIEDVEESGDAKADEDLLKSTSKLEFDDEATELESNEKPQPKGKKKELSPEEKQKREENLSKLREKLNNRINTLREKRKAPGSKTGGPLKSREQILAERKKKEEFRKQEKLKRKAEEMEQESDSDDESEDESKSKQDEENVLFGNIVFNDGTRVTSDLSKMRSTAEKRKMKGPANNDIKAHLAKLELKKQKLSQLDPEQLAKQKDKDQWQRVMQQAEGVKVKDDEKLLKKALKRKEKKKLKSEIEWRDRKQVVKDTVAARAKRREENLQSRRDNKGKKGKKQPRLRKFTGIVNKKAQTKGKKRAGFEGSAKSRGKK